jgi:hypothetical protein
LEVLSLQIARPKRVGDLPRCFPGDRAIQWIDRRNGSESAQPADRSRFAQNYIR